MNKIKKPIYKFFAYLIASALFVALFSCSSDGGYDDDHDGIPDAYERSGTSYYGMPLYDWGARPGQKDIFVHVMMMTPAYDGEYPDGGMILQKKALDRIAARFAANGIAIHFDVGSRGLYSGYSEITGRGVSQYNFSNASHIIPYNPAVTLDTSIISDNYSSYVYVDDIKNAYFPTERWNIFYFLVLGSSQEADGAQGSSGIAWVGGRDFLVTLADWGLGFGTYEGGVSLGYTEIENWTVNTQASTIMHELGHNLGMRHGGGNSVNYKPNYFSIMNYLYQLYGLPKTGSIEGDRYYHVDSELSDSFENLAAMEQSIFSDSFLMDYSHGNGGTLNESALLETQGLRQPGSASVDWNRSSSINGSSIQWDINNDGGISTSLTDYNDWDNLYLFYYENLNRTARSAAERNLEYIAEEPRPIDRPDISRSGL